MDVIAPRGIVHTFHRAGRNGIFLVCLVFLVSLVSLVSLVFLVYLVYLETLFTSGMEGPPSLRRLRLESVWFFWSVSSVWFFGFISFARIWINLLIILQKHRTLFL